MSVQQPSRKVAAYQRAFSDPAVNAKMEQDAARERQATAKRAVKELRKVTAKASGAEADDSALAALAYEIASLMNLNRDRNAAIIREMLPAYLASLAED